MKYEAVIGLEVHAELSTKSKIYCSCSTGFGAPINTHTCPVCTGMPGALPVLNKQVVHYAAKMGKATGCTVNQLCKADRKNYFYPDLPKAYQISQFDVPICENGEVFFYVDGVKHSCRLERIHFEEDAGKLLHDEIDGTIVDFNRCGVPLIEIVSEPDMRSADEVIAYLERLRLLVQYLGASDCKLQEGSMRADVNLSVREVGSETFGTRTEMKNLNSFKAIARAIDGERARQIELLEEGRKVIQETRRWDDNKEYSYAMRSKEDAKDYRYFPDPDLPPVCISDEWLESVRAALPELQPEKMARYQSEYGLSEYDSRILTESKKMADMFEKTTTLCQKPKKVANWLIGEASRLLKEKGEDAESLWFSPIHLAQLTDLVDAGTINNNTAKEVFTAIFEQDVDPSAYVDAHGLGMVNDDSALEQAVSDVLAANPKTVEEYKSGKTKVLGFLVGQVMKAMKGKANPGKVNEMMTEKLNA